MRPVLAREEALLPFCDGVGDCSGGAQRRRSKDGEEGYLHVCSGVRVTMQYDMDQLDDTVRSGQALAGRSLLSLLYTTKMAQCHNPKGGSASRFRRRLE